MSIRIISSRAVAALLIVATTATAGAQQPPSLSKKAQAIKRQVDSLAPHTPISVILVQGGVESGEFLSNDQDGFTFRDTDRNSDVTLRRADRRGCHGQQLGWFAGTKRLSTHVTKGTGASGQVLHRRPDPMLKLTPVDITDVAAKLSRLLPRGCASVEDKSLRHVVRVQRFE